MASKSKYIVGETVLCYHGPLLYAAKCLRINTDDKFKYYIHYNGWSKHWDEWVDETRILKNTSVNVNKQNEIRLQNIELKQQKRGKKEKGTEIEVEKDAEITSVIKKGRNCSPQENTVVIKRVIISDDEEEIVQEVKPAKRVRKSVAKRVRKPAVKRGRKSDGNRGRKSDVNRGRKRVAKRDRDSAVNKVKELVKKAKEPVTKVKEPVTKGESPTAQRKNPVKKDSVVKKENNPVVKNGKNPVLKKEASTKQKNLYSKKQAKPKITKAVRTSSAKTATKKRLAIQKAKVKPTIPVSKSIIPVSKPTVPVPKPTIPEVRMPLNIPNTKIEITLPQNLFECLKSDYYLINKLKRLPCLPARVTVNDVVKEYERIRESMSYDRLLGEIHPICRFILCFFNILLGKALMYGFERLQYSDVSQKFPERQYCDIYGSVHLLRMLINFERYTASTRNSPEFCQEQIFLVDYCIQDFINITADYLKKSYDVHDYKVASEEYISRALVFNDIG